MHNLALTEKRLLRNLEGLGPSNGLIIRVGSGGQELYPLLPEAVRNGNYDMVKLLVTYGADLNPEDWNEYKSLTWGEYSKNTLYFAVRNHDVKMMQLLVDLGANPEQGIYPAILERDRELLDYFLRNGAGLEFALGVAEGLGWTPQKINEYFPEHTPRVEVEAGQ